MLKLDEPQRDEEIFTNLSLFNSSDLGFDSKRFTFFAVFLLIFCPLDPDPFIQNVAEADLKH